jgi:hypothetical protein
MSANLAANSEAMEIRADGDVRCVICDEARSTDVDYATSVLCDPGRCGSNAEVIADALGFCAAHADGIVGLDLRSPAIGDVMRRALRRTRELLVAGQEFEERRLDAFFAARHACPACRFAERRLAAPLARHAARLRSPAKGDSGLLCIPHFRALIGVAPAGELLALTRNQVEVLTAVMGSADSAAGSVKRLLTAGVDVPPRKPRHGDVLRSEDADCPVCIELRWTFERWLAAAATAVRFDIAAWAALPTCPEHILDCIQSGDEGLADCAAHHTMEAALRSLEYGAAWQEREDRRHEKEKESVWYRRKSPAYLLGVRRRAILAMSRCAACERLAVATERAIGEFLDRMRGARYRNTLERRYGLCMKHFAQARVYAPAGVVRDAMTVIHAQKLDVLERELGGVESVSPSWREAIRRYSGSREIPPSACPS